MASFSVSPEGVMKHLEERGISLDKVCLLDRKAEKLLAPEDGDGRFSHFLFGVSRHLSLFNPGSDYLSGNTRYLFALFLPLARPECLFPDTGDDPPRDRTGELRKLGFPGRHLGPVQMTTDTALGVTKIVVHDRSESTITPFLLKPMLPKNLSIKSDSQCE
jgi:hypothetical protein